MFLQDAMYSIRLYGISSSGALPTSYGKSWEGQSHKETYISREILKSSNDDTTTGFYGLSTWIKYPSDVDTWVNRQSPIPEPRVIHSFYVDTAILPTMWWSISPISQHKEPQLSYTVATVPQKVADTTLWRNLLQILQQRDLKTAYTWYSHYDMYQETVVPQKVADTTLWRNLLQILQQRDFFTQETAQDSQKREISERFTVLAQREDNWDGYESKRPTQSTLTYARHLMEELFDSIISEGYPWLTPFISSDEDGDITAEWYEGERELHLLIRENEAESLRVWGTNIDIEMHEDFLSRDDYPTLWEWLLYG